MRNNLTKKDVLEANAFELVLRFDYLLDKAETLPVDEITMADARETVFIEEELRKRLIKLLGRDFYPPEYSTTACVKPLPLKAGGKFPFKITITSSIGSKATEFKVKVDSKADAEIEAQKKITELGLKKATYKIS